MFGEDSFEDEIIKLMQKHNKSIGDDAGVFFLERSVISKDLLIEDVHFRTEYFNPDDLAIKSLNSNISDMSSMGAVPRYILIGIAIPIHLKEYSLNFLKSIIALSRKESITIIGGDTTGSTDKLSISITIIGESKNLITRSNANIGDFLCYVGNLGYSDLGLYCLENNIIGFSNFKEAFLRPANLNKEALYLSNYISSMIDTSDGLYVDSCKISKICKKSLVIKLYDVDFSSDYLKLCKLIERDPFVQALSGGEDYGLLFTINSKDYNRIKDEFFSEFKTKIKRIGVVAEGEGVSTIRNDQIYLNKIPIFDHFKL